MRGCKQWLLARGLFQTAEVGLSKFSLTYSSIGSLTIREVPKTSLSLPGRGRPW